MGKRPAKPKDEYPDSELVQAKLPCGVCGSSDALALYSDGHTYCFAACQAAYPAQHWNSQAVSDSILGDGADVLPASEQLRDAGAQGLAASLAEGRIGPLRTRGISQATCEVWGYRVKQRKSDGEWLQVAPYRDLHGKLVGIKYRDAEKNFPVEGTVSDTFFGEHLWARGGRTLVVVGGEIDAMTVSQCYGHKWPVVSPPLGESNAYKLVKKRLDWLLTFDYVVWAFDGDEVGQAANLACAALMPPGKSRIAKWTLKDPNEMLLKGLGDQITLCIHNAEKYQPGGILDARKVDIMEDPPKGRPWPWKSMTKWTYGRRDGEVYTFLAGTGIGKTDGFAEIIASSLKGETIDGHAPPFEPEAWGVFAFEGGGPRALKERIAGKIANRRFHLPVTPDYPEWTAEEKRAAQHRLDNELWERGGRLFLNDHKGQSDWESIQERIRYLAIAEGVRNFLMDPISAMVAGSDDERKDLDQIILQYALLMGEVGGTGYIASHLRRPKAGEGVDHEEGGQVRLGQARGSGGIGMFTDFAFGWERNTQEPGSPTTLRCVKDRLSGNYTGSTALFGYDQITGRLEEAMPKFTGDV